MPGKADILASPPHPAFAGAARLPERRDQTLESQVYNVNVVARTVLPTPAQIKAELPLTPDLEAVVLRSRRALQNIIDP